MACTRLREISVLRFNVGPKSSKKLSDICQNSVSKLSITKNSQNRVGNASNICQKTVRYKYLSEIYKKRFGKASEMCQILLMSQKTVTGLFGKQSDIYQNSVIKLSVTLNSQKCVTPHPKCIAKLV